MDTVVRVRALQERIARGGIGRERSAADARRAQVDAAMAAVVDRQGRAVPSAGAFVAQRATLAAGVGALDRARDALAEANLGVERSIAEWTEASRRLEGVERLEARVLDEQRTADAAREQAVLDDLVVTRFGRDRP
ncbi:flagellar FliJ family protein [Ilumatobacter sp.]|uniref:flagellar FliJ family protein n=1 Tax=Ilumatobacter sp. TaxID=1967498 RepID=UPI003B5247EA